MLCCYAMVMIGLPAGPTSPRGIFSSHFSLCSPRLRLLRERPWADEWSLGVASLCTWAVNSALEQGLVEGHGRERFDGWRGLYSCLVGLPSGFG